MLGIFGLNLPGYMVSHLYNRLGLPYQNEKGRLRCPYVCQAIEGPFVEGVFR